jgi:ribonuclease HII
MARIMFDPEIELSWRGRGFLQLAGVDEVGRGPLAGPVVAAAVILPEGFAAGEIADSGIADSKALRPAVRQRLAVRITREASVGIGIVPAPAIDALNIHRATLLAMRRAILALPRLPDAILVDGKFLPTDLPCPGQALVKGDSRVPAIAAASIVAKVLRDAIMAEADRYFPGYGFVRNAGYPAPAHRAALKAQGLTPLHRLSYAPCRALLENAG